jgi:hypothetical protein
MAAADLQKGQPYAQNSVEATTDIGPITEDQEVRYLKNLNLMIQQNGGSIHELSETEASFLPLSHQSSQPYFSQTDFLHQ